MARWWKRTAACKGAGPYLWWRSLNRHRLQAAQPTENNRTRPARRRMAPKRNKHSSPRAVGGGQIKEVRQQARGQSKWACVRGRVERRRSARCAGPDTHGHYRSRDKDHSVYDGAAMRRDAGEMDKTTAPQLARPPRGGAGNVRTRSPCDRGQRGGREEGEGAQFPQALTR